MFTCSFTRYSMLYPCTEQRDVTVAKSLPHLWGTFGAIQQITTDGEAYFTSTLLEQVCKLLRIKKLVTSAYNPGSHGIVENRNRKIRKIAEKVFMDIAAASEKNWESYVPIVQRILNAQTNAATGFSPYHLVFGTMVAQDLEALDNPSFDIASIKDPSKYVRDLDNTLNIVFKAGLASLEDRIMKNYLQVKRSDWTPQFNEGDYVLMPNHRARAMASGKFSPRLIGPLKVMKNFKNDFYELRDIVQDEPVFAHGCDLRAFNCDNDQQALEIAARDYGEFVIHSVLAREGDPDKLGQLRFVVTFSDDPSTTTTLLYKEVKFVQLVRDYINKHKDVLHVAAADLREQDAASPTKRVKRISSSLQGYEL